MGRHEENRSSARSSPATAARARLDMSSPGSELRPNSEVSMKVDTEIQGADLNTFLKTICDSGSLSSWWKVVLSCSCLLSQSELSIVIS